jgi:4-oxalomesaconate tautomerase
MNELDGIPCILMRGGTSKGAYFLAEDLPDDAPSLPKISLLAPSQHDGTISTRTFIPVRVHEAIGVLGAVSVATALLLPGAVGAELARLPEPGAPLRLEHPTGSVDVSVELDPASPPDRPRTRSAGLVRTARKLFEGTVFPRPAA